MNFNLAAQKLIVYIILATCVEVISEHTEVHVQARNGSCKLCEKNVNVLYGDDLNSVSLF